MNGNKAVLDSNFIILISKGHIDFEKLRAKYDAFFILIITYMEVYAFDFVDTTEKNLIDEIFAGLDVIGINQEIADQAVIYRKNQFKKLKLPDAIILATAKYIDADLLTEDWQGFLNVDNSIAILNLKSVNL